MVSCRAGLQQGAASPAGEIIRHAGARRLRFKREGVAGCCATGPEARHGAVAAGAGRPRRKADARGTGETTHWVWRWPSRYTPAADLGGTPLQPHQVRRLKLSLDPPLPPISATLAKFWTG